MCQQWKSHSQHLRERNAGILYRRLDSNCEHLMQLVSENDESFKFELNYEWPLSVKKFYHVYPSHDPPGSRLKNIGQYDM